VELLIIAGLLSIALFAPTPVEERRREFQYDLAIGGRAVGISER